MKNGFAFALTAFLCCAAPAFAADEIAPAKLSIARELIDAAGVAQMAGRADMIADTMAAQVKKTIPGIDNEALEQIRKIAHEEFEAAQPAMIEDLTKIYARHFSEAELRDAIAFYKSPTGRRIVAEQPALTRESIGASADIASRIGKRFLTYMQERASKKDHPAQ